MTTRLEKVLQRLPEDLQDQVADFAKFLAERQHAAGGERSNRLKMGWAGKLPPKFSGETGADVSHKALEIRVQQVEDKLRSEP